MSRNINLKLKQICVTDFSQDTPAVAFSYKELIYFTNRHKPIVYINFFKDRFYYKIFIFKYFFNFFLYYLNFWVELKTT